MDERKMYQAPDVPMEWPKSARPPRGQFYYDSRICFGIIYFNNNDDARTCDKRVRGQGLTYNGGFFHGMPCGREPDRDYTDANGVRWYAVTH